MKDGQTRGISGVKNLHGPKGLRAEEPDVAVPLSRDYRRGETDWGQAAPA